ncbi:CIC11C00000000630 [Sungouiella intermedia]|uniref:CIC11C00000000630 n=1 Tax=Sungouiella intermedia TaxID=45354 RepID=A0A1L0B9U6_9ASCO|nr:CIC11C00000000630 [[Candida] intermedia]
MAECPICLDPLGLRDLVGRIHGCLHHYHKQCITQWSSHSNSCPTCRKLYYGIDIVANDIQHQVLETINVKDKLIENDAINQIPPEFIIPPPAYADTYTNMRSEEPELNSGVCTICSSAQYSRLARSLLPCINCGAKFHRLCLGHRDETFWFCPVCDCRQEIAPLRQERRARRTVAAPSRGLVIFNDNNEIEEFDDAEEVIRSTSVLNGGILLRREARAIQNLSPEEARSWELFELARNGLATSEPAVATPTSEARKRRRRRAPESSSQDTHKEENHLKNEENTLDVKREAFPTPNRTMEGNEQRPSRIASLMSQINRRNRAHTAVSHEHSPLSSECLNLADSDSGSELDSKRPCNYVTELTLDQKRRVQKYVRNHLRPLYNPHPSDPGTNESPGSGHIRTEEEYIDVNKRISRQVYASILSLCARNGPLALEGYFSDDESRLKALVDGHVEGWNLAKTNTTT